MKKKKEKNKTKRNTEERGKPTDRRYKSRVKEKRPKHIREKRRNVFEKVRRIG